MEPILRIDNLWKSYAAGVHGCSARVWALRGCSLDINVGERIAIAGREGSGKSTLLECIAGVRSADSGRIRLSAQIFFDGYRRVHIETRRTLVLIDNADDPDRLIHALDQCIDRANTSVIIATRHVMHAAPYVDRVLTIRDGQLEAVPRIPVRRVAERRPSDPQTIRPIFGRHESSTPGTAHA